jgi:hypothetical protein
VIRLQMLMISMHRMHSQERVTSPAERSQPRDEKITWQHRHDAVTYGSGLSVQDRHPIPGLPAQKLSANAVATSVPILASSSAVNSLRANAVGHMAPSSSAGTLGCRP